jgi:hypothetical protein
MRETRLSGSEGGRFEFNRFSLPLLLGRPVGASSQVRTLPGPSQGLHFGFCDDPETVGSFIFWQFPPRDIL